MTFKYQMRKLSAEWCSVHCYVHVSQGWGLRSAITLLLPEWETFKAAQIIAGEALGEGRYEVLIEEL